MAMGAFDGAKVCKFVGLFLLGEFITANIVLTRANVGL